MISSRMKKISIYLGLSFLGTYCKSSSTTTNYADSSEISSSNSSLTKEFFAGLTAAPGTPARQRSGEILEKVFNDSLYPRIPTPNNEYDKESQDRTRRIINLTVEYLKSGTQCDKSQRIRAYRGLGSQNVFFHPPGHPEQGVHVFTDWSKLLTGEVSSGLFGGNVLPGVRVFQGLDNVKKSAVDQIDWATFFGMERQIARARNPNDFINFGWENLASSHSVSSNQSPLISLALKADVSDGFGPGFLVAEICPERALPLDNSFAFGETEIYVPLFVLPEEIVRVEGLECGLKIQNGRATRKDCFPQPLTDNVPISPAAQNMRDCYINFGHPIEYRPWGAREPVAARYFGGTQNLLKRIFDAQTISQARQLQSQALSQCAPSCQVAQQVVDQAKERLSYPPTDDLDKENHQMLEASLSDYLSLLRNKCSTVK